MSQKALHPLAQDYLRRLERAARHLPAARRRELLDDVRLHLVEVAARDATEAEARTALDALGQPASIVAAAEGDGERHTPRSMGREWAAIALLIFGGIILGVGWLVGLVLLWSSTAWRKRDKLLGTIFVPGGVMTLSLVLVGNPVADDPGCSPLDESGTCSAVFDLHQLRTIAVVVLAAAMVLTAAHLIRRMRLVV